MANGPAGPPVHHVPIRSGPSHCFQIPMPYRAAPDLHVHDSHEFYFSARGGGLQHTLDGVTTMRTGDLFCFPAGVAHNGSGRRRGDSVGIVLNLHPDAFGSAAAARDDPTLAEQRQALASLCAAHPSGARVALQPASRPRLRRIFERLVVECRDRPVGWRGAVRGLLQEFLVLLLRDTEVGTGLRLQRVLLRENDQLAAVLRICATQYHRPWTVGELAGLAGFGRSRFHQLFHAATGRGPIAHLNYCRVEAAQRLLVASDRSVIDIAFDVGFGSLSHFYAQFGRISGVAPEAWRRRHREADAG